jgi:hypothetical protein
MTTLEELLNAATVSARGLDITIACDDHNTKDKLLDLLLRGQPHGELMSDGRAMGNEFPNGYD